MVSCQTDRDFMDFMDFICFGGLAQSCVPVI